MSSISFFYLIFASKKRWSCAKKTLRSQFSIAWRSSLFKYFLRSCLSSFRSFFSTFWSFSLISLLIFRNNYSFFSFHLRTRNALRLSSYWKILLLSFIISFSTNFFLLIHKILLSCSFSCSILSWFVRNFLKAH